MRGEELAVDLADGLELLARVGKCLFELERSGVRFVQRTAQRVRRLELAGVQLGGDLASQRVRQPGLERAQPQGPSDNRDIAGVVSRLVRDLPEGYVRFTSWLCVGTGVALLVVAGVSAARDGWWPSAGAWFVAGAILIVWGRRRLASLRR